MSLFNRFAARLPVVKKDNNGKRIIGHRLMVSMVVHVPEGKNSTPVQLNDRASGKPIGPARIKIPDGKEITTIPPHHFSPGWTVKQSLQRLLETPADHNPFKHHHIVRVCTPSGEQLYPSP